MEPVELMELNKKKTLKTKEILKSLTKYAVVEPVELVEQERICI